MFRCRREDGTESAVRLVDDMNRGSGGFADIVVIMGESTLGLG